MTSRSPSSDPASNLRKLRLALLAGTCLTSGAIARADTVTEGIAPAPTDFSATLGSATPMPIGTTVVIGSLGSGPSDFDDYVDFSGLLPGGSFTLSYTGINQNYSVFNSGGNSLGGAINSSSGSFPGTIPNDGHLIAAVTSSEGSSYQWTLNAQLAVPEAGSTAMISGLGVALGAAAMARRTKSSTRS